MFKNDYSQIAHERILQAFLKAQNETNDSYGLDKHSVKAKEYIKRAFGSDNLDIHFLVGGTQTNLTVISYILRDYEAVLACFTGHINVHETASIEATGHKIYQVQGVNGKVQPKDIEMALKINNNEHMAKIRMVYISNSTEIGTIYQKDELKALYECCHRNNLYLFIDGARLGVALTSKENDLTPNDLVKYSDVFYIGGTKNGLMIGEALVIVNDELKQDFRYQIKARGAMLAKGFVNGIQFEEVFKDGLYFEIAKYTNDMADLLKEGLDKRKIARLSSPTNQIFITLPRDVALKITDEFGCELWEDLGDNQQIRLVTSFKTTKEEIEAFFTRFDELLNK